jgi:hypothetical protein
MQHVTRFRGVARLGVSMAAMVVGLVPNLPVSADTAGVSDVYALRGNIPITSGSCGAAVCWEGGTGSYTFASNLCEYASDPDLDDLGTELPGTCTVTAGGNFDNVVCGTGYADGNAAITANTGNDAGGGSTLLTYSVVFVATVGVITGVGSEGDSGPAWVAGAIQISAVPNAPKTPLTAAPCASVFTPNVGLVVFDGSPPPVPLHPCTDADFVVVSGAGGWPLADPFGCLPVP